VARSLLDGGNTKSEGRRESSEWNVHRRGRRARPDDPWRHLRSPLPAREERECGRQHRQSVVRECEALRTLAANGWIEATVEGTTLKIRLGEHAKKVREGVENGAHP
jgi:hypothetical protein